MPVKISFDKYCSSKVGFVEKGRVEVSFLKPSFAKVRTNEVSLYKVCVTKV